MKIRSTIAVGIATASLLALTACTGGGASTSSSAGPSDGAVTGTITFQTWSLKNDKFTPYFENVMKGFERSTPAPQ